MSTKVLRTFAPYKLPSRKTGIKWEREPGEEASQDWIKGALLVRDSSSNEIEELATGGAAIDKIVGVAAHDASGTASTKVGYIEANDSNLFAASLINGTSAVTLAASHMDKKYGVIDSGGAWYVDVSNTTQCKVQVVGFIDKIGDINPRVVVRFLTDFQANVLASS